MRKVDINYRSLLRNKTLHIEVPGRWEDLRPYQFEICARMHVEEISDEEFVRLFFDLKKSIVSKLTKFELFKLNDMASFSANPSGVIDRFYLTEISNTGLISPANRLGTMTFEHFALMDTYFFKYVNGTSHVRLCEFVASLYLKKKEKITEIDFTQRVHYIEQNVDKYTLYAIFLNYLFVRKWLSRSFKYIFDDSDDEKPRARKITANAKTSNLPKWVEIIDGFVGDDILHYYEYTQMRCMLAFKAINNRIKNFKKNAK